jgi:hypothetical protein
VIDPEVDPDRRAWHLAEVAVGPDESLAAGLERCAERARARAGEAAAAAFLERSFELTLDPVLRPRRALAAAHAMYASGAVDSALGLLANAETSGLDELQQAQAARLRAQVLRLRSGGTEGALELAQAGAKLAPLDPDAALEAYVEAVRAVNTGGIGVREGVEVGLLLAQVPLSSAPTPRQQLLHGWGVLLSQGFPHGVDEIARAIEAYCDAGPLPGENAAELAIARTLPALTGMRRRTGSSGPGVSSSLVDPDRRAWSRKRLAGRRLRTPVRGASKRRRPRSTSWPRSATRWGFRRGQRTSERLLPCAVRRRPLSGA